jgi:hypothetical protein
MADKFPKPYDNTVPKDPSTDGMMKYVKFETMGIGARASGLPKESVNQIKSLTHVGNSAEGGKR